VLVEVGAVKVVAGMAKGRWSVSYPCGHPISPPESKVALDSVVNQHLDAAATEVEIRRQRDAHRPVSAVLVEDKANGPAVIQRLKVNIPGVIEINPQGGKTARMFAAAPEWQAGDWFLSRNASWTEPFIEQITTFPGAAHDDMCDCMSQAAAWLLGANEITVTIYNAFTGRPFD